MVVNLVFHLVTYKIQSHLGNTCLDFLWAENFLCTMYLSTIIWPTEYIFWYLLKEGFATFTVTDDYILFYWEMSPRAFENTQVSLIFFFEGFGKVSIKKYFVYGSFHNSSPPPTPLHLYLFSIVDICLRNLRHWV